MRRWSPRRLAGRPRSTACSPMPARTGCASRASTCATPATPRAPATAWWDMAPSLSTSRAESPDHGRMLLAIAREAIEQGPVPLEEVLWNEPWLAEPGATFVTLKLDGDL